MSMLTITAPCRRRYDSHRDAILRADTHQAGSWGFSGGSARPTDEEDLFSYFSARCYSGYGDDVKVSTAFGMFWNDSGTETVAQAPALLLCRALLLWARRRHRGAADEVL